MNPIQLPPLAWRRITFCQSNCVSELKSIDHPSVELPWRLNNHDPFPIPKATFLDEVMTSTEQFMHVSSFLAQSLLREKCWDRNPFSASIPIYIFHNYGFLKLNICLNSLINRFCEGGGYEGNENMLIYFTY